MKTNSIIKTGFVALAMLVGVARLMAQGGDVKYKILEDDPSKVRESYAAVEFLNFEFGGAKNSNPGTVGIGGNFHYALEQKLGIEGVVRYPLFKDADAPFMMNVEGGVFKSLSSNTKTKEIKVRLGMKNGTATNSSGDLVHTQSDLYIMVPATHLKTTAMRGGLYFNKRATGSNFDPTTLLGVYGGFDFIKKTNLKLEILDNGGNREINGKIYNPRGLQKTYVDVVLTPVSSIPTVPSNYPAILRLLGARVGSQMYLDGPKWYNKFAFGVEAGLRPYNGIYLQANVGLQLFKLP